MAEGRRPLLVAVSGIDGSGKSTLVAGTVAMLREQGVPAGSFRALECDRDFLAQVRSFSRRAGEVAERFMADYVGWALVTNTARAVAAASEFDVVLADRYLLDLVANQSVFGNDPQSLRWVQPLLPRADITVLMQLPPDVAWARVVDRDGVAGWQDASFVERAAVAFQSVVAATARSDAPLILSAVRSPAQLCGELAARILQALDREPAHEH